MWKRGKKEKTVLKIFYLWHKILILILILIHTHTKKFFSHYKERGRDRFVAVLRLLIVEAEPGK